MYSRRSTSITKPSYFQCFKIAKCEALSEALTSNFVFSPWSIQLALSLLANCGSTKESLLNFLEAENVDELNTCNKQLLDSLMRIGEESAASINSQNASVMKYFRDSGNRKIIRELSKPSQGSVLLKCVSGVWVDQSVALNPTFRTIAQDVYKGRAETVNFQDKGQHKDITDGVNKWAKEATEGLINSIIGEHSINQATRILLANALYFKGKWHKVFDKLSTKEDKFYLLDGNSVNVPFMSHASHRYIYDSKDFKILKLPYVASSISMCIILPSTCDQFMPLLEKVVSDPTFIYEHEVKHVTVGAFRVPKFKISCKFEVSKSLKDVLEGTKVIHKARIEIDEEGTEAAAVTIMELYGAMGQRKTAPVDFVADHPFIYMVRDYKTGTVLFMGYIVNPLL